MEKKRIPDCAVRDFVLTGTTREICWFPQTRWILTFRGMFVVSVHSSTHWPCFGSGFFKEIFKVYIVKIFEELHFLLIFHSYGVFLREEGTFIVCACFNPVGDNDISFLPAHE